MKEEQYKTFEIIGAILTAVGKFVFVNWLEWKLPYIIVACLFWIGYVIYRARRDPRALEYWGLTTTNFNKTAKELVPIAALCMLLFIGLGNYFGTNVLDWTILPILLLYPFWGIVQQFLTVGLIAKNLDELKRPQINRWLIILLTALIFAGIHYPYPLLILGTFLLALVYATIYLRGRNLLVLGILHGWLGTIFMYTILGRHLWDEVFGVVM